MSKKEKKPLTAKQKRIRYKAIEYSLFASEFLSIITPFLIMGLVNREEWFITNPSAWKIGLGGTLAITLMSIGIFLVTKNKEDKKVTDGYIALVIGWFAVAFIFTLLADIMNQIANIMWFGGLGLLGAFGLNIESKSFGKKAEKLSEAIKEAEKNLNTEEAKKEIVEEQEKKKRKKIAVD